MINTVYAPGSVTEAETFAWYKVDSRLRVGIAYLSKQGAFRFLASGVVIPETLKGPSLNLSAGVQGIGTGNPGYAATLDKNFLLGENRLNVYAGVGFRSNENDVHGVGGVKLWMPSGISIGLQEDGHTHTPFITYSKDWWVVGAYSVGFKRPAYLVGLRF